MEIGNYISQKIVEFNKAHYYQGYLNSTVPEIARMWKEEQRLKDTKWRSINSNKDVMELIDRYDGKVSFVEKHITVGHVEDGYNMALILHDAIQGLRKLALFVDAKPWNNTGFSKLSMEEVDTIFNRLEGITHRMQEQNQRRAMMD